MSRHRFEVGTDRARCWLTLVLAAPVLAAIGWLLGEVVAEFFDGTTVGRQLLAALVATASAGVLAATMPLVASTILLLRRDGPVIRIDAEGVFDLRITRTPVPWDQIEWERSRYDILTGSGTAVSADHVRVIPSQPIAVRWMYRPMTWLNTILRRPGFVISAAGVRTESEKIAQAMSRYRPPRSK